MKLRSSRKRRNLKKIIIIVLSFMFLFSIGFIAGSKFIKKSNKLEGDALAKENQTLQGNKNTPEENLDKSTETTASNKNSTDTNTTNNDNSNQSNPSDGSSSTATNGKSNSTSEGDSKGNSNGDGSSTSTGGNVTKKQVFLTFDDGPTKNVTPRILKVLDDHNVKATFFVIGQNAEKYPEIIIEERDKGHSIANHTYSHDYKYIYSSTSNFIKDIEKSNEVLSSILGEFNSKIIRFPGGSFGSKRAPYRDAVKKAGYTYIDWNALNGDAEKLNVPVDKLIENIKTTARNQNHLVILMHDSASKETTADALPKIIEYLKSQGYEFKTL